MSRPSRRPSLLRVVGGLLTTGSLLLPIPLFAAAPGPTDDAIRAADRLIKDGDYGNAIDLLEQVITETQVDATRLEEAYVVLVRAHIVYANSFRSTLDPKMADPKTAELWESKAREKVRECLSTPGLRHTRPGPEEGFYEELNRVFTEVRNEMFGALRISDLKPPDAVVILDGDTLRAPAGASFLEEEDVPIGESLLVIRAPGYQTVNEDLTIVPGSRLIKSYALKKKKGAIWYASRGAVAAAALVGGSILLIDGGGSGAPEPLPGPPDPPN